MGFAHHLINLLSKDKVFESSTTAPSPTDFAKNQISGKVGGEISDPDAIQSSFEALEQGLDSIRFDYFENPGNSGLADIFSLLINKDRIDFFQKYVKKEENAAQEIAKKIISVDMEKSPKEYLRNLEIYGTVAERLQKIHVLITTQLGEKVNESVAVDDDTRKKLNEILGSAKNGMLSFKNVIKKEEEKIDSLPATEEGSERLEAMEDFLGLLGLSDVLKKKILQTQKRLPKERTEETGTSLSGKKRIIKRLLNIIKMAELPAMVEGRVEKPGDYFKLFNKLKAENPAWMTDSLERYVFGASQQTQLSEFRAKAENEESALEEHQLVYLKASRSWIQSYIESELGPDGKRAILGDKDKERFKTDLNTYYLDKEKEIKNYYVSRDFSLGNFGGLQLKPEIRLPLYTKVTLAVSEEDRKKESPLRNFLGGVGSVVAGIFGGIETKIDYAKVKSVKRAQAAIFNGLNKIVGAGVSVIGGKQAGRDYAEAAAGVAKKIGLGDTGSSSGGKVKEDMLSISDSPGFVAVNPEAPGQMMQTPNSIAGGMDTFALAGPQRKVSSSKKKKGKSKAKKPAEIQNKVASFADFMQRK